MSFSIDGIRWAYPCQIEREAEMTPTEVSGLMLDKTYFNDLSGTWMKYSLTLAVPIGRNSDYDSIYEQLTEPVEGHAFVFPYNSSSIAITGRVLSVRDVYVEMPGKRNYWKGTRFEIAANHPSKEMGLYGALTRGRTVIPGLNTGDAWVHFYIDAEDNLHLVKSPDTALDFYMDEDGILHAVAEGDILQYTPYFWSRVNIDDGDDILY